MEFLLRLTSLKIRRYNSFLLVFLIFLFGLSNIVSLFLPFSIAVVVLTILFVFPSLCLMCKSINVKFIAFVFAFLCLIGLQYIVHIDNYVGTVRTFLYFVSIGIISLFVGSNKIDWVYVFEDAKCLAILNFFTNILYLRFSYENVDMLSMRFGYGILPSAMFFLYDAIKKKSFVSCLLFLITSTLIFIWGSRGALLVILIYLAIVVYKKSKRFFLIGGVAVVLLFEYVKGIFFTILNILPIDSLKLRKMEMMFTEGIAAASSGRDELYRNYWDLFEDNLLVGKGVYFWTATDGLYPHNLFLQAGVEFGITGLVLMLGFVCYAFFRIEKMQGMKGEYMLILFSIVIGRLLVSSSYWERPEFWLLLSLLLFNMKIYEQKA